MAENSRRHYERNREKVRARQTELRVADPEHVRAIARASEAKNRERKNAYNRERYSSKRNEILAKNKARHRYKRYGLTAELFDALLANQGGGCAICGETAEKWHIDHDHTCCATIFTCGTCIRGILCRGCNIGLGNFRDDAELVERAASYLRAR